MCGGGSVGAVGGGSSGGQCLSSEGGGFRQGSCQLFNLNLIFFQRLQKK